MGISPQAMLGHSVGEYVAALAGVISLEDALTLVAMRGRLMQQLPTGSMLAVSLPEAEVKSLVDEKIIPSRKQRAKLMRGFRAHDAVDAFQDKILAKGIDCRRLHTSHAFHSPMMDRLLEPFTQSVKSQTESSPDSLYL